MMFENYSLDKITYSFIASYMWKYGGSVKSVMTEGGRGVQRRPK